MSESLEILALEARRLYCAFMSKHIKNTSGIVSEYGRGIMPHYDGTSTERPKHGKAIVHKSGKDYKPVWPKIAKSAVSGALTVIELIRAQFDSSVGGAPSANSCHGNRAVGLALSRRESAIQESANLLNSFKKTIDIDLTNMHKLLTSKQAVADVVLLSKVPSICKVNILMLMQLEDSIPDEVVFDAVEDYMLRPDIYDAAWGGALHSSFIEKAIRQIKAKRIALGIKTDKVIL
jgi:hypothetical protein